jgi:hypothetical protein
MALPRWVLAPVAEQIYPTRTRPGRPVASGFRILSDDEQEVERRRTREIQASVAPFIEDAERCRSRAAAGARTACIG